MGLILRAVSSGLNPAGIFIKSTALDYDEADRNFLYLLTNMSGSSISITGPTTITGALTVTGGNIIGSLFGTASWATNAINSTNTVSASFASTASYVLNAISSSYASNAELLDGKDSTIFATTGSNTFRGDQTISGSILISGSIIPAVGGGSATSSFSLGSSTNAWNDIWVSNGTINLIDGAGNIQAALSSNANGLIVSGALIVTTIIPASGSTGSYTGSLSGTASFASNATSASQASTASYVLNAVSASFASTASHITSLNQNVTITGSFTVTSGSTEFQVLDTGVKIGNSINDSHTITGSLTVSGSQTFIGTSTSTGTQIVTGSLITSGSNTLIGNTTLSGSINVSGSQTFYGTSAFYGNHTLSGSNTITGNTVMSGSITVSGSSDFKNSQFIVTGSSYFKGYHEVSGSTNVTGSLNVIGDLNVISGSSFRRWGNKLFNYGSFYHTASVTPIQNISGSFIYSTTTESEGVSIVSGSRITFDNTGKYNIQFSAQVSTPTAADIHIWLKSNGTNVADTAGRITTSNNDNVLPSWNYVLSVASGSYLEIAYQTTATNTTFPYIAATGNIPGIPSIILTVTQVA